MNMRKKNIKKIILVIAIITIALFSTYNVSFADLIDPSNYKPASSNNATGTGVLGNKGNIIIGFLQIIGSVLSVIVLSILGIKYMIGSAEEKAEYKKSMIPYVIGAIMVFGITNLLGVIDSFMAFFNNVT